MADASSQDLLLAYYGDDFTGSTDVLESLTLGGIPTVAAYKVPVIEENIFKVLVKYHPIIKVRSVILPNIALNEAVIPELLQRDCTAANLASSLADILDDSPARRRQIDAFARLDSVFDTTGAPPSARAAEAVMNLVAQRASIRP